MSFSIISDIGCDIPNALVTNDDVNIINQSIMIDGAPELINIKSPLALSDFYQRITKVKYLKTGALLYDTANAFISKTARSNDILCFSFSQRLSATGMNMEKACLDCDKLTENKIYYINTHSASIGQGLLIYKAIKLRREGKKLEEVIPIIEIYADHIKMFVALDVNNNFNLGGRAENIAHSDKYPLLFLPKDGLYQTVGYFTNRTHQLKFLSEYVKKHKQDIAFVGHGSNQAEAASFANDIGQSADYCCFANPVMGVHTGDNAILVAYIE